MPTGGRVFTFNEVSKHNQSQDCWLILNGKVYDVTPFMDEHPGGDEVLLSATGKDATSDFDDIGHSESAQEWVHKFHIGEIDASTIPEKIDFVPPPRSSYNPDKTAGFVVKIIQFMVPILILALAFGVRQYTKSE